MVGFVPRRLDVGVKLIFHGVVGRRILMWFEVCCWMTGCWLATTAQFLRISLFYQRLDEKAGWKQCLVCLSFL
jgi:hypothetical protein